MTTHTNPHRHALWWLAATVGLLAGCEEDLRRVPPPRWPAPPEPTTFIYPEDPPVANADGIETLLSGYRRQGYVVLLDVWATWSRASCERFPQIIDLYRQLRPEGFQCIALAFDNPGLWNVQIASFLRSMRCGYPCLIVPPSSQSDVAERLGQEWTGSVPARLIFDRDGQLAAELLTEEAIKTTAEVVRAVLAGEYKGPKPIRKPDDSRVIARSRMLDVSADKTVAQPTSRWTSLDMIEAMARSIADQSEGTIDWSKARVAVLPFNLVGRPDNEAAGKTLADAVARILAARHPESVVDRQEADDLIARYKLTPMAVEYDPSLLAGKANWTHIITGTLQSR